MTCIQRDPPGFVGLLPDDPESHCLFATTGTDIAPCISASTLCTGYMRRTGHMHPGWNLQASYASLPAVFYHEQGPEAVSDPHLCVLNEALAQDLGLDSAYLRSNEGLAVLAGNALPPAARPLAQAYCGHQFGHLAMLGDGRAILLGEQMDRQGRLFDLQYKGSGRTPFSRGGDGRAALKPMLREYLISEAMHCLGIPSTRSLAVVTSGESVLRQQGFEAGAIMLRVAASHLRVGTFQFAAAQGDPALTAALLDYAIQRHYPHCSRTANPAQAFLEAVIQAQAQLLARWMLIGFVHGVMNTDNMSISAETIDYGPCAFMDSYDPQCVFSSIDHQGRYAYGNQPGIAHWNLARLAECLLPLLAKTEEAALACANACLQRFPQLYQSAWLHGMRKKIGLQSSQAQDQELCQQLLDILHQEQRDYTNSFLDLSDWLAQGSCPEPALQAWFSCWQERLSQEAYSPAQAQAIMAAENPRFIPRNQRVEEALQAAESGDWQPWEGLLKLLSQPFDRQTVAPEYCQPMPADQAADYQTFCGT